MGEVYRARDPRIGRDVAIKILPSAFTADRERMKRFEHEAEAAGTLNHPSLLTIFDVGQENGTPLSPRSSLPLRCGDKRRERAQRFNPSPFCRLKMQPDTVIWSTSATDSPKS